MASKPFFNDSVAGTGVEVTKDGTVRLTALRVLNTTAAAAYLQFFNDQALFVTVGTTTPVWVVRLAPNESLNVNFAEPMFLGGKGLTLAGTTTANGNTGAALSVSLAYA